MLEVQKLFSDPQYIEKNPDKLDYLMMKQEDVKTTRSKHIKHVTLTSQVSFLPEIKKYS